VCGIGVFVVCPAVSLVPEVGLLLAVWCYVVTDLRGFCFRVRCSVFSIVGLLVAFPWNGFVVGVCCCSVFVCTGG